MSETQRPAYPPHWMLAPDYDPNDHMMSLKGKDYLNVQHRLLWFMRDQRDMIASGLATQPYSVRNELVEIDREAGWAHFRATVRDVLGNEATMYGSESARDFPDYIEKAGTKALGRALLALGYGAAFAPELDEGERVVDSPADRPERPERRQSAPAAPQAQPQPRQAAKPSPARQTAPAPAQRDERIDKALTNQTILSLLIKLGYADIDQRRAKLAGVFKRLDTKAEGQKVTPRDVMDALEVELTAREKRAAGSTANGHDLQASGAFTQHGA